MALTTEQQALRRRILNDVKNRPDFADYLDKMLQGGDFCMEQLDMFTNIFNHAEAQNLLKQAAILQERAAAITLTNSD